MFIYSWCEVKQWIPPTDDTVVRRCRVDSFHRTISTCPDEFKSWKISKLCETEPTSFVYEGGSLHSVLDVVPFQDKIAFYPFGELYFSNLGRKFRNSHCAACNAVLFLGCQVKNSFMSMSYDYPGEKSSVISKYRQYLGSVSPFMFVYKTDLNQRSCVFHSDGYIPTTKSTFGLETCMEIEQALNKCSCDSTYDFVSRSCVQTHANNVTCEPFVTNPKPEKQDHYLNPERLLNPCNGSITNCNDNEYRLGCLDGLTMGGIGSYFRGRRLGFNEIQFNTEMIVLQPVALQLTLDTEVIRILDGMEVMFGFSAKTPLEKCAQFSKINSTFSSFLICRNQSIIHRLTRKMYRDYLIHQNDAYVCTKYSESIFKLKIYHYILSGISAVSIIIYLGRYTAKAKKTITSKFYVCLLLTVMAALITYSFAIAIRYQPIVCKAVASLVHYLFLSVHAWTNVLALWMFKGLHATNVLRDTGKKTFLKYASYALITPLFFVVAMFFLDSYPVAGLHPVFSIQFCFLADGWIRFLLFTGPIYLQILINIILSICVSVIIMKSGRGLQSSISNRRKARIKVVSVVKLLIILGFQWLLLLFTEITSQHVENLWTALNVMVTLQGFLIVLSQTVNQRNIRKLKRIGSLKKSAIKISVV